MQDFINTVNKVANEIFKMVLVLLPDSPFKDIALPPELAEIMGYVNYYIPFRAMTIVGGSWLTCYAIYQIYKIVLRKVQAIE